ncbi:MAG: MFS transporter [Thermoproteota archaeon]
MSSKTGKVEEPGLRNVASLGIVSLFTDISTEMILGVLPLFVVTELGATKALLGLMEGAAESLNYVFRTLSGIFSDRIARRKPLVLLGYALSTVAKPFFSLAQSFTDAFAIRLTDRAGKGIRTSPRDALISDSVKAERSGRAFGLHRSIDQVGAIVGPVLAFLLIPLVGMRGLFLASLVPGTIALFVLVLFVRDKRGMRKSTGLVKNAKVVLNRKFASFLVVIGIFALGAYNFSFVLVKASALGVDPTAIPLVYATLNAATVLAGLPAGLLADRFGKEKTLIAGFGLFAVSTAAGLFASVGAGFAYLIAFVFGLYLGTSETVQRAIIPSLTMAEFKGTAYGLYYLLLGACSLVANLVFGVLWDQFSSSAAFEYSLVTSLVAVACFVVLIISWRRAGPGQVQPPRV